MIVDVTVFHRDAEVLSFELDFRDQPLPKIGTRLIFDSISLVITEISIFFYTEETPEGQGKPETTLHAEYESVQEEYITDLQVRGLRDELGRYPLRIRNIS